MFVEQIFRQPDCLVLRHPVQMSEYGDGFFCSVAGDCGTQKPKLSGMTNG
jgi:hypothetical protein